jgi:hypothetical protein
VAEAVEREPDLQPAAPVAEGAAPVASDGGGVSDLAGAGHSRPSLSRAVVMRLQGSAGNAAVNGLIGHAPAGRFTHHPERRPTEADSQVMAAIVARAPVDTVVNDKLDVPGTDGARSAAADVATASSATAGPAAAGVSAADGVAATAGPATGADTASVSSRLPQAASV